MCALKYGGRHNDSTLMGDGQRSQYYIGATPLNVASLQLCSGGDDGSGTGTALR